MPHILVATDEEKFYDIIDQDLGHLGYGKPTAVRDMTGLHDAIRHKWPDVILMNLDRFGRGASHYLELLKAITSDPDTKDVRVFCFSRHPELKEAATEAGCVQFFVTLERPISRLNEALHKYLT